MTIPRGRVDCECGYVHDLIEYPHPTVWRAYRETEGGILRAADEAQDRLQELTLGTPGYKDLPEYQDLLWADAEMNRILTYIFECPLCGRLIWNRGDAFADRVYGFEKERLEPVKAAAKPSADKPRKGALFEKIPDSREARWQLMKSVIKEWLRPIKPKDRTPPAELDRLEGELGLRLPRALREWYELAGSKAVHIWSSQDRLVLPFIDREVLVFCVENQGIWSMGVRLSDLGQDDPPVFGWMNEAYAGSSEFGQLSPSVSECALHYLAWCLKWANVLKIRRLLGIDFYEGYGFWKPATLSAIERHCTRCAFPVWRLWGWDNVFYQAQDLLVQVRHVDNGDDPDLYVAVRTKAALDNFERVVHDTGFGWASPGGAWYTK
jgi:hypothetical protein